ncbi:MAG TPA: hypothetical protein VH165_24385 [Kofleriaceae bacterium]|nr:hypothetical protein [Kofleriaceae bacterium]
MGYRDDVDTLYTRAIVLQRELDQMQDKLAQRDAELARLRGGPIEREWTMPELQQLRELPAAETLFSRLVDNLMVAPRPASSRPATPPPVPPVPAPPDWLQVHHRKAQILEAAGMMGAPRPASSRPAATPPPLPPASTPPDWLQVHHRKAQILEAARDRLGELDDETLTLVGAVIEELATEPGRRDAVVGRLRPIALDIAAAHRRRR